MDTDLAAAYERCRELHKRHGRTYYLATRLLPAWKRRHVHALYGFTRYADEIVDRTEALPPAERAARLADWSRPLPPARRPPTTRCCPPCCTPSPSSTWTRRLRRVPAQHGDGPHGHLLPDLRRPARLHGRLGRGDRHDDAADPGLQRSGRGARAGPPARPGVPAHQLHPGRGRGPRPRPRSTCPRRTSPRSA